MPKPVNPVLLKARLAASLEKKRLRDAQKELVKRFATREVAADFDASGFALGLRRVQATVMSCDVCGFTALCGQLAAEETIELRHTSCRAAGGAHQRSGLPLAGVRRDARSAERVGARTRAGGRGDQRQSRGGGAVCRGQLRFDVGDARGLPAASAVARAGAAVPVASRRASRLSLAVDAAIMPLRCRTAF